MTPEAPRCWEIVVLKAPILTVHRAPRARAVEHAEREARRMHGSGNAVRLREVVHCVCRSMPHGGCQPARGRMATIVALSNPEGA